MSHISSSAFSDTKAHYDLLDGLRGVAALMVIWYHIFEGYAFAGGSIIETFNHGYLAVDFFFILSGFVIGYAYVFRPIVCILECRRSWRPKQRP